MDENDEFTLNGDTVRNLEVLAHAPGDLRFRLALARSIQNIHTDIKLLRADMNARFKVQEDRKIMGPTDVAKTAAKEFSPIKKDVERLWSAGVWLLVAMGTIAVGSVGTLITLILTRAFHT
jgi:hypothetical protein